MGVNFRPAAEEMVISSVWDAASSDPVIDPGTKLLLNLSDRKNPTLTLYRTTKALR